AITHVEQPEGAERKNLYLAPCNAQCVKEERHGEQSRRQMRNQASSLQSNEGYESAAAEQKHQRAGADGSGDCHPDERHERMADENFGPAEASFFVQKNAARRMRA